MLAKLNTLARRNSFALFIGLLYAVEFLDELIYGLEGAALPYIKTDLALSYTQIGLMFTVPGLVGLFAEPVIGLLGDTRHRRSLVLGGIVVTLLGLLTIAFGNTFLSMLLAFTVMGSASGAYVNLAQGTLIDLNPARAENTMARWTVLGAIGVTAAPLVATAAFYLGYGWRGLYLALAGVAGVYVALLLPQRFNTHAGAVEEAASPRQLARALFEAVRRPELLRWLLLTEAADLMLDRLLEVTGLYFHDVVGTSLAAASGAVAVSTLVGLVGYVVLVPTFEKVRGLWLLRISAFLALGAYAALLFAPVIWLKYILVGVVSFCAASWWPVLRAKCYQVLPGQSGLVLAAAAVFNLSALLAPIIVGRVADMIGLGWAMWLLTLGPLALIVGLPREK